MRLINVGPIFAWIRISSCFGSIVPIAEHTLIANASTSEDVLYKHGPGQVPVLQYCKTARFLPSAETGSSGPISTTEASFVSGVDPYNSP